MALTPLDVENTSFRGALAGYNRGEVDQFMQRVARSLEEQLETIAGLKERVGILEAEVGKPARLDHHPRAMGDPRRTAANLTRAREDLGYEPQVPVAEALRLEAKWFAGPNGPPALEEQG